MLFTFSKALDAGAKAVVIPHIKNREDAEMAVAAARHAPYGHRAACPAVRAVRYGTDWHNYVRNSRDDISIIGLIEDPEAFEDLDAILSVPGFDIAFLGPFDLAVSARLPVEEGLENKKIQGYLRTLVEAGKRYGVKVMSSVGTQVETEALYHLMDHGVSIINYSANLSVFLRHCQTIVSKVRSVQKDVT